MRTFHPLAFVCMLLLLIGCQNQSADIAGFENFSDTNAVTGSPGNSVKLVRKAAIHFKVRNVEQSSRAVASLVRESGGMLFHQRLESVENDRKELKLPDDSLLVITSFTPQAEITARIPADKLQSFLFDVADLGYFTASTGLDINDKSLAFLENTLKQKARSEVLSRPDPKAHRYTDKLLSLALRDEAIEQNVQNRAIDADVQYSTVHLSLFQNAIVRKEVVANFVLSDYRLPFGQRIANAVSVGGELIQTVVIGLAQLWAFILAGLLLFLSYHYWRRRKTC